MRSDRDKGLLLCFGEALWDIFPEDIQPGGAPLNVAYHLSRLGLSAAPVTAIGKDDLGAKLLLQMEKWGLDTSFVGRSERPTGIVNASLDRDGNAAFRIEEAAAWNFITLGSEQLKLARSAQAIVFGTLALRGSNNKNEFARLVSECTDALKVYDVNLRPPYTPNETAWQIATKADVVKLTKNELHALMPNQAHGNDIEAMVSGFIRQTGCNVVCITSGAEGAGLLYQGRWYWAAGHPVKVEDTVGAGDAFLAALVHGFILNLGPRSALENACRLGEFVATRHGATPAYDVSDVWQDTEQLGSRS